MLASVKVINYRFSMTYYYVKASQSSKNLSNLTYEVLLICTLGSDEILCQPFFSSQYTLGLKT